MCSWQIEKLHSYVPLQDGVTQPLCYLCVVPHYLCDGFFFVCLNEIVFYGLGPCYITAVQGMQHFRLRSVRSALRMALKLNG